MNRLIIIILTLTSVTNIAAQSNNATIAGEYYLTGVREMASGFWLKPDSSFEFFFSYGALDRAGKGRWRLGPEGKVILQSGTRPPADFALISSVKKPGNTGRFKIAGSNPMVLANIIFRVTTEAGTVDKKTDSHGETNFPPGKYERVQLMFELCPDRFSTIDLPRADFNEFTFRIEEWITEVYTENLVLQWKDGKLTGPHPLLEGNQFVYQRQGNRQ